ncbi:MAG TPA: hypothetical protein VL361_05735 [Candidatus Limnocylindrales bacterium]|jgi:hypothetical protein|nr:hypothetical protein [Candidatus Limnocylindrales bacterium]
MQRIVSQKSINIKIALLVLCGFTLARAEFLPITLTPDSYNHDLVVEKTASPPLVPVTTASMDSGLANDNFTWYERGYRPDWPSTGLPKAGSRVDSEAVGDHEYQFAPSYKENNAVLVNVQITNATLKVVSPTAYVTLSFLVSGGNGGGKVEYTIHHASGAEQTGSFMCFDWMNGPNAAYTGGGRVNISTFIFNLDPSNPRLYANDVALNNTSSPITTIDFRHLGGAGHQVIFAVSGSTFAGDLFHPILVTGFNQDLIVEADSTYPANLIGFTTAAVEDGTANSGHTWYEQGYYPPAPETGLPAAGANISSVSALDHHYRFAASYTNNNGIMIDAENPNATILPSSPAHYAMLSFLTAAGHGPVTNRCIVQHHDGTSETNSFVSPDWLDVGPCVFAANGRVKLNRRLVDNLNSPRLFAADISLANQISQVTNLVLNFIGGGLNSHAVIFAVSGSDVSTPPVTAARLSIIGTPGGGWLINSTAPGRLQSTGTLEGNRTVWRDEGRITTSVRTIPGLTESSRFYRVVSP